MTKWKCFGCECMCDIDDHTEFFDDDGRNTPSLCIYTTLDGTTFPTHFEEVLP